MYSVYGLCNPLDGDFWYIGITIDVYQRMRQHTYLDGDNDEKNAVIQTLQRLQIVFYMVTIEQVDTFAEALEREAYWIQYYLERGMTLTNIANRPHADEPDECLPRPLSQFGRKRESTNQYVWEVLTYRCQNGHYPDGMTTAKDRLRMERYYDRHPRMEEARLFVEAEQRGEYYDPGDVTVNIHRKRPTT